jgi:plasmid stabilization system protein ParE
MRISWSPKAKEDFEKILIYLHSEWGENVSNEFIDRTSRFLDTIAENPQMCIESSKRRNVRKGFISKQNSVFYLIKPNKKEIVLLAFWDNRQNPKKSKY